MPRTLCTTARNMSLILAILVGLVSVLYHLMTHSHVDGQYLFYELFIACVVIIAAVVLLTGSIYISSCNRSAKVDEVAIGHGRENTQITPIVELKDEGYRPLQILGVLCFCICAIVFSIFKLYGFIKDKDCSRFSGILLHCAYIFFYVIQTFLIITCQRYRFVRNPDVVRLCLGIVFVADMCIWCHMSLSEIYEGIAELSETEKEAEDTKCENNLVEKSSSYLIPAAIEYSMIAALKIFEAAFEAGERIPREKEFIYHHHVISAFMHASRIGAAVGLVCVTCGIASAILLNMIEHASVEKHVLVLIFLAVRLGLLVASFVLVIIILRQTRDLTGRRKSNTMDEVLLLLAACGTFVFYLFMISSYINDLWSHRLSAAGTSSAVVSVVSSTTEIIQVVLQTSLIYVLTDKCANSERDQIIKPGRGAMAALGGLNMALWIIATFEIKKEIMQFQEGSHAALGTSNGITLLFVVLPLLIFYRFHSTSFIFDLWNEVFHRPCNAIEDSAESFPPEVAHVPSPGYSYEKSVTSRM